MTDKTSQLNAARLSSERAAVLSLLPATKARIMKKTGLAQRRVEIALRGMWLVGKVYEQPTKTAQLN